MSHEIEKSSKQSTAVEQQVQNITNFLDAMGLPSDNIIAPLDQRQKIWKNLPDLIGDVSPESKKDARYLSKVVVGAGFGLFDYSLNSIWNEVVIALRKIAIAYGLEIFFDKAVGGSNRSAYRNEEDFASLKDIVLLDTCRKLELITDTTYRKLAHILDMRNDIGISHPTNAVINAFELMGWVETCIKEVLENQPSADAILVKSFILHFKEYPDVISQQWIDETTPKIKALPTQHCDSVIRVLFGLFLSKEVTAVQQKNISLLAPVFWPLTSDDEKNRLGFILAGYHTNLKKDKHEQGKEFFKFVNGNAYMTLDERIIHLDNLTNRLKNAHYQYDNYYHEGKIMEEIMSFINKADDIPQQVANNLVSTVVLCRLGRGLNFHGGVSPTAKPLYDDFFRIIGPKYAPLVMIELTHTEAQRKMSSSISRLACRELLSSLNTTVINGREKEGIEYLIANILADRSNAISSDFQKISTPYIKWTTV